MQKGNNETPGATNTNQHRRKEPVARRPDDINAYQQAHFPLVSQNVLTNRRLSKIQHPAQQLPAKDHAGGQAGDVIVVGAIDIGLDGVFALYLLSAVTGSHTVPYRRVIPVGSPWAGRRT